MSSSKDNYDQQRRAGKHSSPQKKELGPAEMRRYGFYSLDQLLDFCFEKKVDLTNVYSCVEYHQDPKKMYTSRKWTDSETGEFQALKSNLNSVKDQLDHYDLNKWHQFTRTTNPADLVMKNLRNKTKVEFLTQAWCKFYELVDTCNLIPLDAKKSKNLYSIHLCEAPGAFVTSLNHYLRSNYPDIKWNWKANSLNPFYEGNSLSQMINDDRFMMRSLEHWHFGPDQTGNIMHSGYPSDLANECGDNLAHLVTADGSIDCQDNPNEQESTVSWLHLKETLTALRVLRKGGCFVIKMFTFLECETICLLYLLYTLFESLQIIKPATSKEGNSEVYVVCREYKGVDIAMPYLERFYDITEDDHQNFAMFSYGEVDIHFRVKLLECARFFVGNQMNVIRRNIRLFHSQVYDKDLRNIFKSVQLKAWEKFVARYDIKPIPFEDNIVSLLANEYNPRPSTSMMEKREHRQGLTHAQQLVQKKLSEKEIFATILEEHDNLRLSFTITQNKMPNLNDLKLNNFNIVLGKPIQTVVSSQFCHGTLIRLRKEIIDTISIQKYNILSQDKKNYDHQKRNFRQIIDFRDTFCDDDYNTAQWIAFRQIYNTLKSELRNGDDLVLVGFPLLTRFNISLLCFLRRVFQDVEVKSPSVLYLHKFHGDEIENWGPKLDIIRNYEYSSNYTVLSFFPLEYLNSQHLYPWLFALNNATVSQEIQSITIPK